MLDRIKNILKAELNSRFSDNDLDIDEILKKFTKSSENSQTNSKNSYEQEYTDSSSGGYSAEQPHQKSKAEEYYQWLELPNGAPFSEVKKSYRKLMKVYHPDLFHGDKEKHEMAQEVSRQLNEAYNYFEKTIGK